MTLDYTPYGITPLTSCLPSGTAELQRGVNWREALTKAASPLMLTPQELRMTLTIMPMLKKMYVDTLRRTVLGEDTTRTVLRHESLLQRTTPDDNLTLTLPYQEPLRPTASDIELYTPKPGPVKTPEAPEKPRLHIPSPEDVEEYSASEHTKYARTRALYQDKVAQLNEHFGHINDCIKRFAIILYEDIDQAEALLKESAESARQAAQLLEKEYDSPHAARFAAEDVTHQVEHMLEVALTDALKDLPKDPEVIDRYLNSAKELIAMHVETTPGTWR